MKFEKLFSNIVHFQEISNTIISSFRAENEII